VHLSYAHALIKTKLAGRFKQLRPQWKFEAPKEFTGYGIRFRIVIATAASDYPAVSATIRHY
jgi:hypothetical protein